MRQFLERAPADRLQVLLLMRHTAPFAAMMPTAKPASSQEADGGILQQVVH